MITQVSRSIATKNVKSETRKQLRARTREVLSHEIGFIPNPCFREMDADKLWRKELATSESAVVVKAQSGRPLLQAHLERMCSAPLLSPPEERDLFCRMNYLKYRANAIRSTLNDKRPSVRKLDEVKQLLDGANGLRNRIVHANTRLVVSIVKTFASDSNPFDDLLSEGIACMLKAAEKFDFDRGFRFSTYATMAVRREVFRSINRSHRDRTRFATGATDILDQQLYDETPEERTESAMLKINSDISRLLTRLDDREQFIVKARYGLIDIGMKPTFSKLGETLGVSKERVRQLQLRAMSKLRDAIDDLSTC